MAAPTLIIHVGHAIPHVLGNNAIIGFEQSKTEVAHFPHSSRHEY